jgi:hypothetical protein
MSRMADHRSAPPASEPSGHTRSEFDELARELQALRDRHQALLGARAGQVVRVELPGGREPDRVQRTCQA